MCFALMSLMCELCMHPAEAEHVNATSNSPKIKNSILHSLYQKTVQGAQRSDVWNADNSDAVLVEIDSNGMVYVDISAVGAGLYSFQQALDDSGCKVLACTTYMCSVLMPIDEFPRIENLDGVRDVRPSLYVTSQQKPLVSEAVPSHWIDRVQDKYPNVDGRNLKIGILSGSFDLLEGYSMDVIDGELPPGVEVLKEETNARPIDEGRAMAQLVHDIAPASKIVFHTAQGGQASAAMAIQLLAEVGCDVIVDDFSKYHLIDCGFTFLHSSEMPHASAFAVYFNEPFFQDGVIAQAVETVTVDKDIPYFSSAGNHGSASWEGSFVPSGVMDPLGNGCELHDFGNGTVKQQMTIDRSTSFVLQWDDLHFSASGPPGATRDIDLYVERNGIPFLALTDIEVGGDPVLGFDAFTSSRYSISIAFCGSTSVDRSPPSKMKWVGFGGGIRDIIPSQRSGTIIGHANARHVAAVGSAYWNDTPRFGTTPALQNDASSVGGVPILFDAKGNRFPSEVVRSQPRFIATDGVRTSFFGVEIGVQRYFFGTSAAAPNAAAISLLLRQTNPSLSFREIYSIMEDTALEMNEPGFDFKTGYGFLDAAAALERATRPASPSPSNSQLGRQSKLSKSAKRAKRYDSARSGTVQSKRSKSGKRAKRSDSGRSSTAKSAKSSKSQKRRLRRAKP